MKQNENETAKVVALFATGFLTEIALIQSMMRSKTLTVMVLVGVVLFVGFFYFLFNMAT